MAIRLRRYGLGTNGRARLVAFTMNVLRPVAIALTLLVCATPTQAQSIAPEVRGPVYVVVPVGEPGDTDPQFAYATQNLVTDLSNHRIRSTIATPLDTIEAVADAPVLCTQYTAGGILVSQLKFEQTKERNLTGFIPVIGGVISSSGAFDASPIRARLKLYLVDCRGKVAWKTITTANKVHHGQNVAAGLTEIASEAIANAVDEFASRRYQAR
ncbi:MAG: hypothetical protein NVSMB64_12760 [Candidatus Velthaea sp.]